MEAGEVKYSFQPYSVPLAYILPLDVKLTEKETKLLLASRQDVESFFFPRCVVHVILYSGFQFQILGDN